MTGTSIRIAQAFDRASAYDDHASVQQRVAGTLAQRLCTLPLGPAPRVLEFGCGTGFLAAAASDCFADANWLMTDLSAAMVERSRQRLGGSPRYRFAVMDAEHPQLTEGEETFDLVCSNLTAQWLVNLPDALERLSHLVRPGGFLSFSTLVEGTFAEWENAHSAIGMTPGTLPLPNMAALAALRLAGVAPIVVSERIVEDYPDARSFLHSLRAIGAATPRPSHRPLPVPAMRAVMRGFEQGGASATYVVAFCCFRRPMEAEG